MPTKFSQFNNGGAIIAGDTIVGLRGGVNTKFTASALPSVPYTTLVVGQSLFANNGYFLANAAPAVYTLPTTAPFGSVIQLININISTCTIAQNAGQQILFGNTITTLGVGGSIQSVTAGDGLTLVCYIANTNFVVLGGAQGIWNIV